MNFKVGDKVIVIAGKDKGKEGKIITILKAKNRAVIEGVNIVKKHQKPSGKDQAGGIVSKESPIHASNIMLIDPKTKKRTRIAHTTNKEGKKIRISVKSKEKID